MPLFTSRDQVDGDSYLILVEKEHVPYSIIPIKKWSSKPCKVIMNDVLDVLNQHLDNQRLGQLKSARSLEAMEAVLDGTINDHETWMLILQNDTDKLLKIVSPRSIAQFSRV